MSKKSKTFGEDFNSVGEALEREGRFLMALDMANYEMEGLDFDLPGGFLREVYRETEDTLDEIKDIQFERGDREYLKSTTADNERAFDLYNKEVMDRTRKVVEGEDHLLPKNEVSDLYSILDRSMNIQRKNLRSHRRARDLYRRGLMTRKEFFREMAGKSTHNGKETFEEAKKGIGKNILLKTHALSKKLDETDERIEDVESYVDDLKKIRDRLGIDKDYSEVMSGMWMNKEIERNEDGQVVGWKLDLPEDDGEKEYHIEKFLSEEMEQKYEEDLSGKLNYKDFDSFLSEELNTVPGKYSFSTIPMHGEALDIISYMIDIDEDEWTESRSEEYKKGMLYTEKNLEDIKKGLEDKEDGEYRNERVVGGLKCLEDGSYKNFKVEELEGRYGLWMNSEAYGEGED